MALKLERQKKFAGREHDCDRNENVAMDSWDSKEEQDKK